MTFPALPALLFDLDGTLINSIPDLRIAVNRTLADDGLAAFEDPQIATMVGNGARVLITRAYAAAGAPLADDAACEQALARFLAYYDQAPAAHTHVYEGVFDSLEALRQAGYPMAICTNKPHAPTMEIVAALGLAPFFSVILGAGKIPQLKPDPAPLLAIVSQMGYRPEHAVMIGDSHNDSHAAQAAGMPSVCVTFGYRHGPLEDLGADCLIDHFSELPAALHRLWEHRQTRS